MKFTNQSGGSAGRAVKAGKAGQENPAKAQAVELGYSRSSSKSVAAMAGSFSRKIPGPVKAGQSTAGKATPASGPAIKGKQLGYTVKTAPAFIPAWESMEHSGGTMQKAKGSSGMRTGGEAKGVAGRSA